MTIISESTVGNSIALAEKEVRLLFANSIPADYSYHDLTHTERVVEMALEMAKAYNLSDARIKLMGIAAWFHDSGYSMGVKDHEINSSKIATDFLTEHKFSSKERNIVVELILSTKIETKAYNVEQRILRDADLHYLGGLDYFDRANKLREEWEHTQGITLNDSDWYQRNLDFMSNHTFETSFGRKHFNEQKQLNINLIKEKKAQLSI